MAQKEVAAADAIAVGCGKMRWRNICWDARISSKYSGTCQCRYQSPQDSVEERRLPVFPDEVTRTSGWARNKEGPERNLQRCVDEYATELDLDEAYKEVWTIWSRGGPKRDLRGRMVVENGWIHPWSKREADKEEQSREHFKDRNDRVRRPANQVQWWVAH